MSAMGGKRSLHPATACLIASRQIVLMTLVIKGGLRQHQNWSRSSFTHVPKYCRWPAIVAPSSVEKRARSTWR